MSGLNITYPIKAGSVRGALHGAADTDWHTLTSADFKDSVSGSACASGLRFATISLINTSTSAVTFLKLRAAAGTGDATTNEIAIAPSSVFTDDIGTLRDTITSIAYKKGASGDALYIVAGFDKE
jgi:hypothetical protein